MELTKTRHKIGKIDLLSLTEKYDTPLYVYDGNKIISQYEKLKNAFKGVDVKIKYAIKALTNQSILKLLKKAGSGIDTVSINEVRLGLEAGFSPEDILFTPNCAPYEELQEAVELGVAINIDNIPFLKRFGEEYGHSVPVCVRINPHIDAGGNAKIRTGHRGSKFGVSYEQIEEVYETVVQYNIKVTGVHVHSGSDFKDEDAFVKAAQVVFDIAKNFPHLEFLDFGSGFKVAYKEGDHATNISALGEKMSQAFKKFQKEYSRPLQMWFEPGKFLVSESGFLLVKATLIKETPATKFVGVNSGLNHLIRPMMYDAYHDIVNLSNTKGEKEVYTVVGYICETDTLGEDRALHQVSEGDILMIKNAGAYAFSMSSNYNSRLRPAEVLVFNDKDYLIRKRETLDDLLRNQVDIELG